ncbi:MAG: hypothetical protein K9K66_19315 [Desulfarculaceae bacterium]|nr:hypothetical protein [Desulfarculaceae bacterium]MCF8074533.1 hypothetical protein [Desulfarculaceae bacterium]MCF8103807.1 hypothetical protein [Desulfarculaceae bacterium]MCF8117815.1 hypothetical protein [Desulfarculaceae bacterium]
MKLSKLATTMGLCLAVVLGVYLAAAGQSGNCNIGGETGPGVKAQLNGKQKSPEPAAKPREPQKDQPAAAKPQQPTASQPGAAPLVPIIAPDEGC